MRRFGLPALVLALLGCQHTDAPLVDAGLSDASEAAPSDAWSAPRIDGGHDAGPIPTELEGFIGYQMSLGHIPGVATAIIDHGAVVHTTAQGMATDTTSVDEHTLFLVASISKTFVAALILGLVEDGTISLDEPAETYLGYPVRSPMSPDHAITVRELMAHTSGMVDDWVALGQVTVTGDPTTTLGQFASAYVPEDLHYTTASGTRFDYCNAGFGVLGAIVEAAGHEDLRMRTARTLTGPLALDGAGWWLADVDQSRLAIEYSSMQTGGVWHFIANPQRGFGHYTATSMRISITGLSRWLLAHTLNGTLDGVTFLSQASIDEERRVQFQSIAGGQGLVWYYRNLAGSRWLSHSGSSFGASSDIVYREDGRGLVVMTNSDAFIRERLGQTDGSDAIEAIMVRLNQEADTLAAAP
jgi:CubicO group peptidase (beta-lactamase class C family)